MKRLQQSAEARPHQSTHMSVPDGPLESSSIPVTGKSASFRNLFEAKSHLLKWQLKVIMIMPQDIDL